MPELLEPIGERLPLTGTFNVRDAGGYAAGAGRVRRGLLLRGDALGVLDADSLAVLGELGLRTIIDLRAPAERAARPTDVSGLPGVRVVQAPLFDPAAGDLDEALLDDGLPALYRWLIAQRGEQLTEVIRVLADPDALPALVHCSAGKDRTGMIVGLVHAALGVGDEDIARDFGRRADLLGDDFAAAAAAQLAALGLDATVRRELLAADPAWMREVLALVRDEHDGIDAYLTVNGLAEDDLRALRALLLETETTDPALEG